MKTRDGLDRSKSKTEKPEDGKALLGLSLGDRRKKGKKKYRTVDSWKHYVPMCKKTITRLGARLSWLRKGNK